MGFSPLTWIDHEGAILRGDVSGTGNRLSDAGLKAYVRPLIWIFIGSGIFGASMGWWRSPVQAGWNGIKFPMILFLTAAGNLLLNGILAPLLGAKINFRESFLLVLTLFEIFGFILAALAPINFFLVFNLPSMEQANLNNEVYAWVLMNQIAMVGFAGLVACWRMVSLLSWRTGSREIGYKVFWAWLSVNLLLGTQLTWILRPLIGTPGLPVQLLRPDAFQGSFFEAAWMAFKKIFGLYITTKEKKRFMNTDSNIPPKIPQQTSTGFHRSSLGDDPAETVPIQSTFQAIESLLREPRRFLFHLKQGGNLVVPLILVSLACLALYGLVMGSFSGGVQLWRAPVKAVICVMVASLICFPSLYVFASIAGAKARLSDLFTLIFAMVTILSILLLAFAPVALLFSTSTQSEVLMGTLHLVFWIVSVHFGIRFLIAAVETLGGGGVGVVKVWTLLFLMVVFQMTTALRPLLGTSDTFMPTEKKFFLKHWSEQFSNKP
jgi:hypothetical protein